MEKLLKSWKFVFLSMMFHFILYFFVNGFETLFRYWLKKEKSKKIPKFFSFVFDCSYMPRLWLFKVPIWINIKFNLSQVSGISFSRQHYSKGERFENLILPQHIKCFLYGYVEKMEKCEPQLFAFILCHSECFWFSVTRRILLNCKMGLFMYYVMQEVQYFNRSWKGEVNSFK